MPRTKKKRIIRKWWTIVYLTREGTMHPAHSDVDQIYKYEDKLLDDLTRTMSHELGHRGAYAAGVWLGELSEQGCLYGPQKPAYYVFQGGRVEAF